MVETLAQALAFLDPYKTHALQGVAASIIGACICLLLFALFLLKRRHDLKKLYNLVVTEEQKALEASYVAEALLIRKTELIDDRFNKAKPRGGKQQRN